MYNVYIYIINSYYFQVHECDNRESAHYFHDYIYTYKRKCRLRKGRKGWLKVLSYVPMYT